MGDCAKEVILYSRIKIDVEKETDLMICEDEQKMKIKVMVLYSFLSSVFAILLVFPLVATHVLKYNVHVKGAVVVIFLEVSIIIPCNGVLSPE